MNFKLFNGVSNSISLLVIVDSVSLNCSARLKRSKISTLQLHAKFLKACSCFVIFTFFTFF